MKVLAVRVQSVVVLLTEVRDELWQSAAHEEELAAEIVDGPPKTQVLRQVAAKRAKAATITEEINYFTAALEDA